MDFSSIAVTKGVKYGAYAVGLRFTIIGVIFFLMLVVTLFNFSNDVNQSFTFSSLLEAIRGVPQIDLIHFKVSDDVASFSDKAFDFGVNTVRVLSAYRLPNRIGLVDISGISNFINGIITSITTPLINSLLNFKTVVHKFIGAIFTPLDFFNYLVGSFYQLLRFIAYFVARFFYLPILN